ncbi:MAG: hypothetical protein R6U36_01430 [Candidatus Fermentibacteraceae bacterium]
MRPVIITVCAAALLLLPMASAQESGLPWEAFVHPEAMAAGSFDALPGSTAAVLVGTALDTLYAMGAEDIVFCGLMRIEAPLGGWLADGLFDLERGGARYGTFRVGVSDSGSVFALMARGSEEDGGTVWLPAPGPDCVVPEGEAAPEGLLTYEFLLEREEFEDLDERFEGADQAAAGGARTSP